MIKLVEQLQQLQEKKWKKWVETFEDEDTHEMVDVEREELLTTETSDEEHELWRQIIPELPKLSDEELRTLQRQILSTDIDNIPIVEVLALRGNVDALSQVGDIATLQELCEQGNQVSSANRAIKMPLANSTISSTMAMKSTVSSSIARRPRNTTIWLAMRCMMNGTTLMIQAKRILRPMTIRSLAMLALSTLFEQ